MCAANPARKVLPRGIGETPRHVLRQEHDGEVVIPVLFLADIDDGSDDSPEQTRRSKSREVLSRSGGLKVEGWEDLVQVPALEVLRTEPQPSVLSRVLSRRKNFGSCRGHSRSVMFQRLVNRRDGGVVLVKRR